MNIEKDLTRPQISKDVFYNMLMSDDAKRIKYIYKKCY